MGEVYRAEDTNLSRDVAIKVLPEEFAYDPERLGRLGRQTTRPVRDANPCSLISRVLSLVVFALFSYGQTSSVGFTIYGIVRLPDGLPAPRVTVQVSSQVSPPLEVFTSDLGRYEIPNLPRGHFWLSAISRAAPELLSESVEVEISRTSPARLLINLYLRRTPSARFAQRASAATISLTEATQHVPKPARKAFQQARALRLENECDKALQCLNLAVELFPGYFQALAERGLLRISIEQPEEAAVDFAQALELNGRYEPALRGSGICKFREGEFEDATKFFERAVAEAPGVAVNYLFLGICNAQLDRRDAARAALHRALEIDPVGAARAHVHLANLLIKERQLQYAIAELEAYLAALPRSPDADSQRRLITHLRESMTAK